MESASRWPRVVDRLARFGWLVLVVSVVIAVLGGMLTAALDLGGEPSSTQANGCEDPPCFGGGGLPGASDLPTVLPFLGYGLAFLLGAPSALTGVWSIVRGRWSLGWRSLLVFVGPLLFIIGTEIVPHVVNPCLVADLVGEDLPGLCERTESGADIAGRGHALYHTLVGALPMLALYAWALLRWRPKVLKGDVY
ncbi:MAG: hypothetical protein M3R06_02870 [Chloroflexota bacterium]|nr:hypothetical protein [Chloroflexota bacterium]